MQTRAQLKEAAKKQLQNKWKDSAIFTLVILLMSMAPSFIIGKLSNTLEMIVSFLIAGPLAYATTKYFYDLSQGRKVELGLIKEGFIKFKETTVLYILMFLKILLWTLLLIIPGIIAGIKYSQAFYILNENPDMNPNDILKKSSQMMEGHKMRFFVLQLSFIGWGILAMLTFGIGFLWLTPYIVTTMANFYEEVKWEGNLAKKEEAKK